jgi:hypothetical protein
MMSKLTGRLMGKLWSSFEDYAPFYGMGIGTLFGSIVCLAPIFLTGCPAETPTTTTTVTSLSNPRKRSDGVLVVETEVVSFSRLDQGGSTWMYVARTKVPGGWLVGHGSGLVFISDPEHTWLKEGAWY